MYFNGFCQTVWLLGLELALRISVICKAFLNLSETAN